jgi:hypothetical protein
LLLKLAGRGTYSDSIIEIPSRTYIWLHILILRM